MPLTRRRFLNTAVAALAAEAVLTRATLRGAALSARARVDRALAGGDVDRPPISLWHHFGLEKEGPARHAEATLAFHRDYQTDLVKVMSDFPFPKPSGAWHEVRDRLLLPRRRARGIVLRQLRSAQDLLRVIIPQVRHRLVIAQRLPQFLRFRRPQFPH